MDFLRFLESLRTPVLDRIFSALTFFGDVPFFLVLSAVLFWCVSKRDGIYMLLVGFIGTLGSQFMKLWFRVPRPFALDPTFTVVESARESAGDYSFPSGHTQSIVGAMMCLLMTQKRRWVRILAIALMLLVPFSRMYLGCHTPLDVGVGFALAVAVALLLYPPVRRLDAQPERMRAVSAVLFALSLLYIGYLFLYPFPADADAANLAAGIKNGCTIFGCAIGLVLAQVFDPQFLRFEEKAVWWVQLLKCGLGLAAALAIKSGLKAPLQLFLSENAATTVRYALLIAFVLSVWPRFFPLLGRLADRRTAPEDTK